MSTTLHTTPSPPTDLLGMVFDRSARSWEVYRISGDGPRRTERFFYIREDALAHLVSLRARECRRARAEIVVGGLFVRAVRANIAAMTEATGLDTLAVGSGIAAMAKSAGIAEHRALAIVLRAQGSANL